MRYIAASPGTWPIVRTTAWKAPMGESTRWSVGAAAWVPRRVPQCRQARTVPRKSTCCIDTDWCYRLSRPPQRSGEHTSRPCSNLPINAVCIGLGGFSRLPNSRGQSTRHCSRLPFRSMCIGLNGLAHAGRYAPEQILMDLNQCLHGDMLKALYQAVDADFRFWQCRISGRLGNKTPCIWR